MFNIGLIVRVEAKVKLVKVPLQSTDNNLKLETGVTQRVQQVQPVPNLC